jgi:hypothetical protein
MPQVGLVPTIPVFEWAKTVHALDSSATVMDTLHFCLTKQRAQFHCVPLALVSGCLTVLFVSRLSFFVWSKSREIAVWRSKSVELILMNC